VATKAVTGLSFFEGGVSETDVGTLEFGMMVRDVTYRLNPDVISASVGDEVVLLSPSDGTYFGLNTVAARTWQLLEVPRPATEIVEQLVMEFDVDRQTLERDVTLLFDRLLELKLVSRDLS
jgi:hypothetical protein